MFHKLPKFGLLIFLTCLIFAPSALRAQPVMLDADGPGQTYELLSRVLGGTPYEVPDCGHADFGRHITEEWDDQLQTNVFVFHIHAAIDNDRCTNFDRQRNEIKTYDPSPANLKGTLGETHIYLWKFKIDSLYQPSPNFCHLFQIKPVGGPDESAPIITITPRFGTPEKLQIIHTASDGVGGTVTEIDLAPLKGQWLEVHCRALYRDNGKIEMTIKKLDGTTVLTYDNYLLDMWRLNANFNRPKWGIYRSLNSPSFLRDEQVRFANFSIAEGAAIAPPASPTNLTARAVSSQEISLTWEDNSNNETNFLIQRSEDGTTWSNVGAVDANATSYLDQGLLPATTYYYRIRSENWEASSSFTESVSAGTLVSVANSEPGRLPNYVLNQNYPNPFNPATKLSYSLREAGQVKLEIFNIAGQRIATLVNEFQQAGDHETTWNTVGAAADHSVSGIFFARLRVGEFSQTLKLLLTK